MCLYAVGWVLLTYAPLSAFNHGEMRLVRALPAQAEFLRRCLSGIDSGPGMELQEGVWSNVFAQATVYCVHLMHVPRPYPLLFESGLHASGVATLRSP